MQIDKDLISKLEKLARLNLSDKEKETLASDLGRILNMVEKLQELDTENVEPLVQMSEAKNIFREDIVKQVISRDEALKNAPDRDGKFIKVPKVIK
ncbi:MAG: Asp-tRNA(Asn)/Glu-tRNA(Gln) amidotransferase subunit GatC [Bacteroidota bacterium]